MEILKRIYAFSTKFEGKIRHGCWVCTVINPLNDDKALISMAKTMNAKYLLKLNELKKSNEEIEKIGMDIAISYEKSQGRTLSYSKPC